MCLAIREVPITIINNILLCCSPFRPCHNYGDDHDPEKLLIEQMVAFMEDNIHKTAPHHVKWRQILSNHTTNRPQKEGPSPMRSIAAESCKDECQVGNKWFHRFTIKAPNAFHDKDGLEWCMSGIGSDIMEATQRCCVKSVALLLLIDLPGGEGPDKFRLLQKDWNIGVRTVAQKGRDMMKAWLATCDANMGHASGGPWLKECWWNRHAAQMKPCRTPSAMQKKNLFAKIEEIDRQIQAVFCKALDRHALLGRTGFMDIRSMPEGDGYGKTLHPHLLEKGKEWDWLQGNVLFEVRHFGSGEWGLRYAQGP